MLPRATKLTVHMGTVIPLDGVVVSGEAMVNQASMTGESQPVRKEPGQLCLRRNRAGRGRDYLQGRKSAGSTRYERIVQMIEDSEKLKSSVEGKASNLADALVPWSLGGTALTYLLTRNATKALSILMVDFSCALKLAMPLAVLSAMREASQHHITVKGGKFLEAVAEAETIVFDKTGTPDQGKTGCIRCSIFQRHGEGRTASYRSLPGRTFPAFDGKRGRTGSEKRHLVHEEMHSRVDYIVAHGIATYVGEERVVIGSHHFVFEDEKCTLPEDGKEKFENLPENCSHLYMAIGGQLAAVICIEDPLREEAPSVIRQLKEAGFKRIVMMTGDSERTAAAIAKRVGVDDYFSEVLPEDKARFVEEEKAKATKLS